MIRRVTWLRCHRYGCQGACQSGLLRAAGRRRPWVVAVRCLGCCCFCGLVDLRVKYQMLVYWMLMII